MTVILEGVNRSKEMMILFGLCGVSLAPDKYSTDFSVPKKPVEQSGS